MHHDSYTHTHTHYLFVRFAWTAREILCLWRENFKQMQLALLLLLLEERAYLAYLGVT